MDFCTMGHPYLRTSIVNIFSLSTPHVLFSCYCTLVNRRLGIYLDEIFSRHAHKKKSCQTCLSAMNISPSILGTRTKGLIWLGQLKCHTALILINIVDEGLVTTHGKWMHWDYFFLTRALVKWNLPLHFHGFLYHETPLPSYLDCQNIFPSPSPCLVLLLFHTGQ